MRELVQVVEGAVQVLAAAVLVEAVADQIVLVLALIGRVGGAVGAVRAGSGDYLVKAVVGPVGAGAVGVLARRRRPSGATKSNDDRRE